MPFFWNPRLEYQVAPVALPQSLPWERDSGYDDQRHWRRPSNAMLQSYGANAFKSLARSHPAVLRRWHHKS